MTLPNKNLFLFRATEGKLDPCRHLNITAFAGDAYLSTSHWSQGQTRPSFDTTWECGNSFANAADPIHAIVGDYIFIESDAQKGEFLKVVAIQGNLRVTLESAWSVDQGAVDWSLVKLIKERSSPAAISDLFEQITSAELDVLLNLLIRLQGRLFGSLAGDGSEYDRPTILSHLNNSIVEITL